MAATAFVSCSETDSGSVSMLPVRLEGSDSWSLVDSRGDIIAESRWATRPTMAVNGFFTAAEAGGITVYAVTADEIKPVADSLVAAGTMTEGRMPVCRTGRRIELIDTDGHSVATLMPADSAEIDAVAPYFSSGRMIFRTRPKDGGHRYGAIDTDGNVAVAPRFGRLFPFHNGIALAAEAGPEPRYMLVDTDGHTLFTFPDSMQPLTDGVSNEIMPVSIKGGRTAFINTRGTLRKMPESVRKIVDFTDRLFVYTDADGRAGLMTTESRTILSPRYHEIAILDNDHFLTTDSAGICRLVDRSAHVILEFPDAESVTSLRNLFPFTSDFKIIGHTSDNTYIIYDDNGNPVGDADITDLSTAIVINPVATDCGDMIRSDYFDIDGAAEALTSSLSANGFGPALLGQPISGLLTGEPREHASTTSANIARSRTDNFTLRATASSSIPAAHEEAVYSESEIFNIPIRLFDRYEYRFNPEAVITRIIVKLTTPNPTFALTRRAIEKRITDAGFSIAEQTDAYTMFRSAHALLFLLPEAGSLGSRMEILPTDASAETMNVLRREAEINFNAI